MAAYNIKDIKDKKKLINLANYGTAERRLMRPRVLIGAGEEKPFIEGDILDANATLNLIEDTYDKGRIFRSFSKEGKKIDKEIKELLEKTDENYEQLSSAIADNKEDADQKIDQLSSKVDNIESNIPNLRRVVDIQLQSVLDGTKTYLVTKQGDVQEQIQISDGERGELGEKGDPFTYEDFTPEQIEGLKVKGDRGISISSLEQTQTAYTSGGVNEFTVTLDDGTVSRWYVRNGLKGDATKIWVNANTVHSGYYDSDDHEIKLLNADGGIMSIIDATAFIKDGMISDAYVENGYIVIVFNTDAGQTPIMIPVTDIFDADDYYTKQDTDRRIAEDVLVETQRAEAAEWQLASDLAQEVSDRLSSNTTLDTKIETETTRATAAEGLLDQKITSNNAAILAEAARAAAAESALSDAIDAEESTRIQEIDDLQDLLDAYIQSNDAAVQAEVSRATAAEQTNATAIATESSRAQSAELALLGAINTEASTRVAAITAEETRATTAEQALQDNIDAEEQRAIAAELDLLDAIDAVEQGAGQDTAAVELALNDEISRATLAEQLISSNLSAEITRATNADDANATAISNEVARATLSEQQNAADIDAIEALIPSQATSENQLADKAFVNSSIATNTATFVGTFNSITDLYAVTTADVNDYGYVVTTDAVGNTKYNRYKYDGSQWGFEYALNNSSFTAEEWAAIQSGMTQALRTKLENLPSTAVTSVDVSVPTGLTVTGSPITSSGTIAINFTSGYSIPTTSSLTNWDTAYGWGNHANANYVKLVKVGTTAYNPASGVVLLPAYPTVPTKVSQLTNDAGYITSSASITGNAGSATKLQTARTIWGLSFNGTANVSGNMTDVGTISASGNITITKTSGVTGVTVNNTNGGANIYYNVVGKEYSMFFGIGSDNVNRGIYDTTNQKWALYFDASNTILNYGNVGIGTAEPTYKLHVTGTVGTNNAIVIKRDMPSDTTWTSGLQCLCPDMTANQHMQLFVGKATSKYNTGNIVYNHSADGSDSNSISIGMYGADNLICAKGNGNVGVGTASPAYKLDVQGTLGVNGLITATGGVKGNVTGNATNVTGTVAIDHGGTGATTRLNALKALTNENVGTSALYFLTITTSWGEGGYTSVADAKTVLAMKGATSSAAGTAGVVPAAPKDGYNTKYLRADGTWQVPPDNNTTYSNMTAATASAAGKAGLVPAPAAGKQTSFLRGDGTWVVPTNTTYSDFVKSGSSAAHGLVPKPSTTAGTTHYLREDGTWTVPPNTTYSNFVKSGSGAKAGLVPAPSTTAGTTHYLREDGTWVVPTDTKNTAGSTNSTSKLFLIGATSQDANPQTYSNSGVYTTSGSMYATNFYTTSDLSKKDNITSLSEHIRKFTLKETGKEHYGVIALEVPEMFRDGEEGSYTVNYNSILSYYVGTLENKVKMLEERLAKLEERR